jgi:hypothetical protein
VNDTNPQRWVYNPLIGFAQVRFRFAGERVPGLSRAGRPSEVSLKDLPEGLGAEDGLFKIDPYLEAAATLQLLGQEGAITTLKALAAEEKGNEGTRAIVLCRMLFTSKKGGTFRRPMLGQPDFIGDSVDWPLEPIALVDGIPFLITTGYSLRGVPELGSQYLAYCIQECEWSNVKFGPKTDAEKTAALNKLLRSERFKEKLSPSERQFLAGQIK